jgi:phage-related protein
MMTFTSIPSWSSKGTRSPRIRQAKFNGQFELRETDLGYNDAAVADPDSRLSDLMTWDLVFTNRPSTELEAINDFLSALGGAAKFLWVEPTPFDVRGTRFYACEQWDWTYNRGGVVNGITALFEEQPPLL